MKEKLEDMWKRCEAILESYLQEDEYFLTLEEVRTALLHSGLAASEDSLNDVLLALHVQPGRRYTVYDVERAALLLSTVHQDDDIFTILVETLDPESTGAIHINQLKCLLGKFGTSVADAEWRRFQNAYASDGSGKFTYKQLRNILKRCEDSKNHESGRDERYSTTERS